MEIYFLKSVVCLGIFLLFYKLLLEKENMHVFKRFYLLTAMLAAVAIPYITIITYVEPAPEVFQPLALTSSEGTVEASAGISKNLETALWLIYFLGVFFFSIKFCRNLLLIIQRIRKNPKIKGHSFITVLLTEKLNPHTFFSFIFLNKIKYEKQEIPEEVIIHEQAHAVQKHSLDILLVEFAQIIFWFNPLLFLLKDTIKLNHEFLADDSVLKQGTNPTGYKKTLLSYSSGGLESGLVNSINYSSIKKRFTVMKTRTSRTAVCARSLLVLPLLAVLVYGFSAKKTMVKAQDQQQIQESIDDSDIDISEDINIHIFNNGDITVNHQTVKLDGLEEKVGRINGHLPIEKRKELTSAEVNVEPGVKMGILTDVKMVLLDYGVSRIKVSESATTLPDQKSKIRLKEEIEEMKDLKVTYIHQEKATPEMIAEYNRLVKHYNSLPEESFTVKQEDANRMMYILSLMTPEQKGKAEKIRFDIPPPPPPAPEPIKGKGENMPVPPPPQVNEKTPPVPPAPVEEALPAPPPPPVVGNMPQAPPPPPPVTFEELVKDGATFFYNGKIIKPEEARKLVEVEKKVNIHITSTNDEKPVVRLTDKKDKK